LVCSPLLIFLDLLTDLCIYVFPDLIKLKRINITKHSKAGGAGAGGKKSDALISRYAPGFCFDFNPTDANM